MNVYFDHAATTSTSAAARAAALRAMEECWGNPSSLHAAGRRAAQRLDEARQSVARCLAASPAELYFTSGGTEADNWAITQCARMGAQAGKCHLITSAFEHHAVLHTMERLEQGGWICWQDTLRAGPAQGQGGTAFSRGVIRSLGSRGRSAYLTLEGDQISQVLPTLLRQLEDGSFTVTVPLETRL